jgi:Stress-induced bacterial acidophilic repeat motif.
MPGTINGGKSAAETNKERYGEDFYKNIGRKGGLKSRGGGFAYSRKLASEAGRKGGLATQRKREEAQQEKEHQTWRERVGL